MEKDTQDKVCFTCIPRKYVYNSNMAKNKNNLLLEKVVEIVLSLLPGKLLDLGCGDGKIGKSLFDAGFKVEACDMDEERFQFPGIIPFKRSNFDGPLPYCDNFFDCLVFTEVIEHVYNPGFVISEVSRVLKTEGKLVLSTPNILNIGSRLRFLFEGSFDFFREPTLDFSRCFPTAIQNMHVIPWRYQELEYLLYRNGLEVTAYYTDKKKMNFLIPAAILKPFLYFQALNKEIRVRERPSVSFKRINRILLSDALLLGRHLIIEAVKK